MLPKHGQRKCSLPPEAAGGACVLTLACLLQQSTISSKRSKTTAECSGSVQCTAQPPAEVSATAAKSDTVEDNQLAGSCAGHAALPKENRSPNLTLLDHLEAELDTYAELDQVLTAASRSS